MNWGRRRISQRDLREPRLLELLWRIAVERKFFRQSEQEHRTFFALAHLAMRQKCRSYEGLFSSWVDDSYLDTLPANWKTWMERLADEDDRWAVESILALTLGAPRPAAAKPLPESIEEARENALVEEADAARARFARCIKQQGAQR